MDKNSNHTLSDTKTSSCTSSQWILCVYTCMKTYAKSDQKQHAVIFIVKHGEKKAFRLKRIPFSLLFPCLPRFFEDPIDSGFWL